MKILSRNVDQKSIEIVFSIAICHPTGDKWQSKTLFLSIFYPSLSIVDYIFNCRLPCVYIWPTLSPSCTSMIFSPLVGLIVGNVLPDTEFTNSLLIKIWKYNRSTFKIKKLCVSGYPTMPNSLPPTLNFLSIFRGFPSHFQGRPSCFPIFPM